MSENLKAFLAAWIEWVDVGAVDGMPFKRRHGLCYSFENWMDDLSLDENCQEEEQDGLTDSLHEDGLDRLYPFGGCEQFYKESHYNEMHLNADRISWVRSKVAQFAEA